jgi:hypothetical protein
LTVIFTPSQVGAATGTLTFTDADGSQAATLSGTGEALPTDTISVTTLTFPATVIGQLSTAQTVTLTNSGGEPLTSIAVSVSGANAAAFQVTNPCTANLGANSSCTISVQFDPSVSSSQAALLTISSSAADSPKTVSLSGTGLQPPALSVSPPSLSFTVQTVGQASSSQTVTVSNTGGAPLANVGFQITGLSSASFAWSANTCGTTLSNGSGQNSCTVQVVFTPAAAGGSTASLVVSSSTSGVTAVTVPLTGAVQSSAGLNVNPAQLLFPIVAPGQSSPVQTVTITNNSGSSANALTLAATSPFSLVQNGCPASLANGANCSTGVVFSPALNGSYTGTLTVASTSLTSAVVPLSGTGGTPGSVQFLPSLLTFQQTGVGLVSGAGTVTITNPDSGNSLGSLALAVTAGFQLVSTSCASTLAAGASCAAVVEFAPTSPGAQSGSLIVTSSALTTGSFMPLSGMGFDFSLAPSGSSTQTVANGQTADYQLSITPLLGSQGVFTFQCGSLPPYSSCIFNPASEGIAANSSGYEVVEIATGVTPTSARSSRNFAWPVLPLACGLALLPFAGFASARRRRALLLIALLAILAGGVSSCTESNVVLTEPPPGSGPGLTPTGTYSIPVTATSNGVQHQVTLTLTVD